MKTLSFCFGVFLLLRFELLGFPALTDPSEGRFASISQHILRDGEWMSPKIFDTDHGWILYQAKPPLFMWLQALSMKMFGETTLAARIPAILGLFLTLAALIVFRRSERQENSLLPAYFYLCLPLSFFIGTSGITDAFLVASTTWLGVAGLIWLRTSNPLWILIAAFASAIGFLIKGPVVLALTLPPALCLLASKRFRFSVTHIIWASALFLAIVTPIMLLIEKGSPGFLKYFLLQENFGRYLSHDFENHYGSVKHSYYGGSFLYLCLYALPFVHLISFRNTRRDFLIFAIWPAIFFAFSTQVLVSYLLPSAPWIALIMAESRALSSKTLLYSMPSIVLCFVLLFGDSHISEKFSGKEVAIEIKKMGINSLELRGLSGRSIIFYGTTLGLEFKPKSNNSIESNYILAAPHLAKEFSLTDYEVIKEWRNVTLFKSRQVLATDP